VLEPISEAEIAGGLVEFEHALRHRGRDRETEARERPASLGRKSCQRGRDDAERRELRMRQ